MFNSRLYLGRDSRYYQGQLGYDYLLHIQRGGNSGFIDEETYEYFDFLRTPSKYKFRCSIGNNDEMIIYNYPTGIYYLRNGEMKRFDPLDYFDKMRISEIANNKDGYIIGTYWEGLYKISNISN